MTDAILEILGWNTDMREIIKGAGHFDFSNPPKPFVACLSHTSKWELFFYALYKPLCEDELRLTGKLAMAPQYVDLMGKKIANNLDIIPATRLEDKGKGFVTSSIELFKDTDYNMFVIAPEGTLKAKPWRTGFYHIAKGLGWDLRVVGFDFEEKSLYISDAISSKKSYEEVQTFLQKRMHRIVPFNLDGQVVPIRPHDIEEISVMDDSNVFLSLLIIILLILFYKI